VKRMRVERMLVSRMRVKRMLVKRMVETLLLLLGRDLLNRSKSGLKC
jgi:hypothetical protein